MKALCFDRWYCDKEMAAAVAAGLTEEAGCYIVGLVECPEGSWGVLYINGPDWEPDWHLVTADPRIVADIASERKGGGS